MPKAKNGNAYLRPVTLGARLMESHIRCDGKSCPLNENYYSNNSNMHLRDINGPLRTALPTRNPSNKGILFSTWKCRIRQISRSLLWLKTKSNVDYNDIQLINLVTFCRPIDNMRPSNPLSIILDNNRLTGPNFIDWLRNLKVILASEKILYMIELLV